MSETSENRIDAQQEFEALLEPEALLSFLDQRVSYGFVGKNNKVYTPDEAEMDADFQAEYALQAPEELLVSGRGVCWDTVELERRWFTEHGFNPETYFLMYAKEGGTELPTHTFVVYEKDDTWYWFEQSFADQRGIHAYTSREALLNDVREKHHAYATRHRGATAADFSRLRITTYSQPKYGSSPQEFVDTIVKENPRLLAKDDLLT